MIWIRTTSDARVSMLGFGIGAAIDGVAAVVATAVSVIAAAQNVEKSLFIVFLIRFSHPICAIWQPWDELKLNAFVNLRKVARGSDEGSGERAPSHMAPHRLLE